MKERIQKFFEKLVIILFEGVCLILALASMVAVTPRVFNTDPSRKVATFVFILVSIFGYSYVEIFFKKPGFSFETFIRIFTLFMFIWLFIVGTANSFAPFGILDYIGVVLFAIGAFVYFVAEYTRHKHISTGESIVTLFKKSVFRLARNADCLGILIALIGWTMITRNPNIAILPLTYLMIVLIITIPFREEELMEKHKWAFLKIKDTTKKLIPFIY